MADIPLRDAFFNKLYEIAKKDKDVIVISADMGAPSLDKFRENLPSQFINVGIAEQCMVTVATGLALSGKKVYAYAIMPFSSLRCYEPIKVTFSLMDIGVTVVGVGSGFGYPDSGPTHHATEDIAVMRTLPNMTIFNSSDAASVEKFAEISYKSDSPCYIRLDRQLLPNIHEAQEDFSSGLAKIKAGKDLYIIATGNMVHKALEITKLLEKNSI